MGSYLFRCISIFNRLTYKMLYILIADVITFLFIKVEHTLEPHLRLENQESGSPNNSP